MLSILTTFVTYLMKYLYQTCTKCKQSTSHRFIDELKYECIVCGKKGVCTKHVGTNKEVDPRLDISKDNQEPSSSVPTTRKKKVTLIPEPERRLW